MTLSHTGNTHVRRYNLYLENRARYIFAWSSGGRSSGCWTCSADQPVLLFIETREQSSLWPFERISETLLLSYTEQGVLLREDALTIVVIMGLLSEERAIGELVPSFIEGRRYIPTTTIVYIIPWDEIIKITYIYTFIHNNRLISPSIPKFQI